MIDLTETDVHTRLFPLQPTYTQFTLLQPTYIHDCDHCNPRTYATMPTETHVHA
jgi:hypothetical protein